MRNSPRLYAIAFLVSAPIITGGAYQRWSGPSSGTDAVIVMEQPPASQSPETTAVVLGATETAPATELAAPISRARERVTLKPFGIEIHPETSPVPNDRFDGIHVGTDFETFADEQDADVPIYAICEGRLQFKVRAKGYGGVAVQECVIDGRDVSVIYGHLNLASIEPEVGQLLRPGDHIGLLGQGFSQETDGVRKHLHLGLRERVDIEEPDILGYVKTSEEVAPYLDVLPYLPQ